MVVDWYLKRNFKNENKLGDDKVGIELINPYNKDLGGVI